MRNATIKFPATTNPAWGFFGTMKEKAEAAWPIAMDEVAYATGATLEGVRTFLDSRHGRHFADGILGLMDRGYEMEDAIRAVTQQWMDWKITKVSYRELGIPRGLPYLTGYVTHYQIANDAE